METGCKLVAVLTLLTNVPHNCFAQKGSCNKVTSCKCAYDDGAIVDLTQTASTDGTAKFTDISGKVATTLYSWNPCTSFTEGTCENVAVCQIQEDLPPAIYTPVGSQDSAVFTTDDDGNLAIKYQAEQRGVLRTTLVTLTCYEGSAENFEVKDGKATEAEYFMEFTSQFACPIVVTADHLSVGTYIIIIFSSIALSFFIVGIMVQKFVRKKSGKNVIPFVDFWVQLPVLVKFEDKKGEVVIALLVLGSYSSSILSWCITNSLPWKTFPVRKCLTHIKTGLYKRLIINPKELEKKEEQKHHEQNIFIIYI